MRRRKLSEVLRDVRARLERSPHPMDHRSYPKGSGPDGVTKAEVLASLTEEIACLERDEVMLGAPVEIARRPER